MQPKETPAGPIIPEIPEVPDVKTISIPENSHKNYVELLVLTTLFGLFGVDRFYLGKIGTGILKLITFGGLGLWYCFDAIVALGGGGRQKGSELPLEDTAKYKPFFMRMATWSTVVILVIVGVQIVLLAIAIPKIIDQAKGLTGQMQQGNQSSQAPNIQDLMNELQ